MVQKNLKATNVQRDINRKDRPKPVKASKIQKEHLNTSTKKIKAQLQTSTLSKVEQQVMTKAVKNGAKWKFIKPEEQKNKLVGKLKKGSPKYDINFLFLKNFLKKIL